MPFIHLQVIIENQKSCSHLSIIQYMSISLHMFFDHESCLASKCVANPPSDIDHGSPARQQGHRPPQRPGDAENSVLPAAHFSGGGLGPGHSTVEIIRHFEKSTMNSDSTRKIIHQWSIFQTAMSVYWRLAEGKK